MTEIDQDLEVAVAPTLKRHGADATRKALSRLARQIKRSSDLPSRRGKKPQHDTRLLGAIAYTLVELVLAEQRHRRKKSEKEGDKKKQKDNVSAACRLVSRSRFWRGVANPPASRAGARERLRTRKDGTIALPSHDAALKQVRNFRNHWERVPDVPGQISRAQWESCAKLIIEKAGVGFRGGRLDLSGRPAVLQLAKIGAP